LVSPSGTTIRLISRRGGAGDNFTNTVLDDEATTSITSIVSAGAPFTGSFRPESPLSAIDGQNGNGAWQLKVADRANLDVGILVNWSLIIAIEPATLTDSSGFYAFLNLDPATYTVRQVLQSGWNATGPAGGSYSATIVDASTALTGRDFGQVRQS